jgi:hypothetical protein
MNRKDQVFVVDVVVINPMREMMALSVISQPIGAVVEFSAIAKFHKFRRLHETHCFIPMAMEVHGIPRHDMDHFIKECARLFHDRQLRGHFIFVFLHLIF